MTLHLKWYAYFLWSWLFQFCLKSCWFLNCQTAAWKSIFSNQSCMLDALASVERLLQKDRGWGQCAVRKQLCSPYRQFQTDWPVYLEHVHKLRDAERSGMKPEPRASAALLYRALKGELAWLKYYHSQTSLYCLNSRTAHNQTSPLRYTWHTAQITFMKYSINITRAAVKHLRIIIETQRHWEREIRVQMRERSGFFFFF